MLYQKYEVAHSLDEVITLLNSQDGRIMRPIAGGTDLILQLHEHILTTDVLVDVSRVPEMRGIRIENDQVVIGAASTFAEIYRSPIINQHAYLLVEASRKIGAIQIQNMGTIGGNIGNASPAADAIPCLYALRAEVVVCGHDTERYIPIEKFHLGYRKIDLNKGEIIKEIRFPLSKEGLGSAFYKYGLRKSQAISVVDAAACIQIHESKIEQATIALGAVAPTIIRSYSAESVLIGQTPSIDLITKAGEAARSDAHPIDDIRGSAAFRRYLVAVCVSHAIRTAFERAGK